MFNYANLNDVEFEALCKDVMEKKLLCDYLQKAEMVVLT